MLASPAGLHAPPRTVFRHAEAVLEAWRAQPPDMADTVASALEEAAGAPVPAEMVACGAMIAQAVAEHAELCAPPYHDQRHQAEAARAMGWLCSVARRRGELTEAEAACGVLAMAGHDLRHDGLVHPAGELEALSAGWTVAFAAACGLDVACRAAITRIILATDTLRPPEVAAADDLLCRIGQEADLFGSLTPGLGLRLGHALRRELEAAGVSPRPPVDSFAGRLAWLRSRRPVTEAGRVLGLADGIAHQIDAMTQLGLGNADRGARTLDALPAEEARARIAAALEAR